MTLAALRGRIVAVTFMDSHCRQECPIEGRELAIVQRSLGPRSPLVVVVITVNPQDSGSSARVFTREVGLTGEWHWLLGTKGTLEPVWRAYGILVAPTRGDISHTAAVYLIDQAGWMRVADGVPLIPAQLEESVRALAAHRP